MMRQGTPGGADQRRHYRVASGLDALLGVTLGLEGGREIPAELVDLSASGACLRWPLATTPVLDLSDTVQLSFQTRSGKAPLKIQATVRWMAAEAESIRYGFEFQDASDLAATGDATLWALFNRRRTPRG
jgi:c-di-GMP-binding flagellar brake protein YcgR